MTSSKRLSAAGVIVLTGVLALSLGQAAFAQWEDDDSRAGTLQGTWRVEIRHSNCATGVPDGPPFQSSLTFARGGTLTGTTANAAFLPGQRSPDHGVWSYKHRDKYSAASEAFLLFDSEAHPPFPGFLAGTRISQEIELKSQDEFTSAAIVEFFDVNRNSVLTGCAVAIGRRFE